MKKTGFLLAILMATALVNPVIAETVLKQEDAPLPSNVSILNVVSDLNKTEPEDVLILSDWTFNGVKKTYKMKVKDAVLPTYTLDVVKEVKEKDGKWKELNSFSKFMLPNTVQSFSYSETIPYVSSIDADKRVSVTNLNVGEVFLIAIHYDENKNLRLDYQVDSKEVVRWETVTGENGLSLDVPTLKAFFVKKDGLDLSDKLNKRVALFMDEENRYVMKIVENKTK